MYRGSLSDHKSMDLDRLPEPTLHLKFYLAVFPFFSKHMGPGSISLVMDLSPYLQPLVTGIPVAWCEAPCLSSATQRDAQQNSNKDSGTPSILLLPSGLRCIPSCPSAWVSGNKGGLGGMTHHWSIEIVLNMAVNKYVKNPSQKGRHIITIFKKFH